MYDHNSLVKAIKEVDVVISTVGAGLLADQVKLIDAIKEAGNVKVNILLISLFFLLSIDFIIVQICFYNV